MQNGQKLSRPNNTIRVWITVERENGRSDVKTDFLVVLSRVDNLVVNKISSRYDYFKIDILITLF